MAVPTTRILSAQEKDSTAGVSIASCHAILVSAIVHGICRVCEWPRLAFVFLYGVVHSEERTPTNAHLRRKTRLDHGPMTIISIAAETPPANATTNALISSEQQPPRGNCMVLGCRLLWQRIGWARSGSSVRRIRHRRCRFLMQERRVVSSDSGMC